MSVRAMLMAAAGGITAAPAGQAEFVTAGTHSWTVPDGVTSICAVLVQGGANAPSTLTHNSTLWCRAQNGARIGDGGGDGGQGGQYNVTFGGGGGAGGYSGNGGVGGIYSYYGGQPADPNSGGGGGGGPGNLAGGGVGLKGKGATGLGGGFNQNGFGGSGGANGASSVGGLYGGGPESYSGGALSYKNAIPVTPGTTVTIVIYGNGGARIIWGEGRYYPSTNTEDV